MGKQQYTIELPAEVGRRVMRAAKRANRNLSDVAADAFRVYFSMRAIPEETPTSAELRAIGRGRAAFKRGDYVTLDDLRREEALARRPRRTRTKVS